MTLSEHLLSALNNPQSMWQHALRQLTPDSRRIFLTLPSLPNLTEVSDVQAAFSAQAVDQSGSFLDALNALEGSFVTITGDGGHSRYLDFRNPSIGDFAQSHLESNLDWLDVVLSKPIFYEQISVIVNLSRSRSGVERTFPGIDGWVQRNGARLLQQCLELLDARRPRTLLSTPMASTVRLGQSIALAHRLRMANSVDVLTRIASFVETDLAKLSEVKVGAYITALQVEGTRNMLATALGSDLLSRLRVDLLESGRDWRFSALARIDRDLGLVDVGEGWRDEAIDYCRGLARQHEDADDVDDLSQAIDEIQTMERALNIDLSHLVEPLQAALDEFYPDEEPDPEPRRGGPREVRDDWPRIDDLFDTLSQ